MSRSSNGSSGSRRQSPEASSGKTASSSGSHRQSPEVSSGKTASTSGSRRQSPEASSGKTASPSAPDAIPLNDVIAMMHQVVLREAAGARVTPVGREMARAILSIRGAELGARGLARDEAANDALRYLFREVAARLAGVWRDEIANAEAHRSPLWAMRAAPEAPEAEDIYYALGVTNFSDPLDPKLRDVGAIYDRFVSAHLGDFLGDEESFGYLSNQIDEAAQDARDAVRARVHTEIGASFSASLKARLLRAMRMEAYEATILRVGALAIKMAVSAAHTPRGTAMEDATAMEEAVRAVAQAARERLAIVRDVGAFARAVFGASAAV